MSNIEKYLQMLEDFKQENLKIENHPMAEEDFEQKNIYLKGLTLVMGADEEIKPQEKNYMKILLSTLSMPQEGLDDYVAFAQNANTKFIPGLKKLLQKNKDVESFFISDCYSISYSDSDFHKYEKALLQEFEDVLALGHHLIVKLGNFFKFLFETKNTSKAQIVERFESLGALKKCVQHQLDWKIYRVKKAPEKKEKIEKAPKKTTKTSAKKGVKPGAKKTTKKPAKPAVKKIITTIKATEAPARKKR